MVLTNDSLNDVIHTVVASRDFKDHLMKFILLQLPASISAMALILAQIFYYDTILVSGLFVYLINLLYLPIGLTCMVREDSTVRQ
jgi:magnesium-transporting ATPase (P-type)